MRAGFFDHYRSSDYIQATASAGGIAQGALGPCPDGYVWYVERTTTWSNSSGTPVCELFAWNDKTVPGTYTATVGSRGGRQDVTTAGKNDVSDNKSPVVVQGGYYLVAFWSGLTQNDLVTLSAQICVHQLVVNYLTSPQDEAQIREAHEHAGREHAALSHGYATGELAV